MDDLNVNNITNELYIVWWCAIDALTSNDFRHDDGTIIKEDYLEYQSNTIKHVTEKIRSYYER